jgi:DNA-binding CsgD family transcriptional regulator
MYGFLALRSDDPTRLRQAERHLQEAKKVFASYHSGLQFRRSDALLVAVRSRLAEFDSPWEQLSPRERDAAAFIAEVLTNRQMAAKLGLSTRTVEDHITRILRKLDTPSRTAAAAILSRAA